MKTGLIMEGGAMRGMFTAGVLDVLMENGLVTDGAIGVSAGAVFGCNYKSHQIGRTIRYNTTYCKDKRYASFRNLLRTGNLYSENFCYHEVPEKLDPFDDKAFRESPMDYFVVCTDVRTGDPIYHKCRTGDAEDVLCPSRINPVFIRVILLLLTMHPARTGGRMQKTGTFPCARSAPEIHPEPLLPVYSDFAEKQERKCQKTLKTGGQIRYTR